MTERGRREGGKECKRMKKGERGRKGETERELKGKVEWGGKEEGKAGGKLKVDEKE